MLPLWFANELFQAWLMQHLGLSDGIAYWAHVGGFVFGGGIMVAMAVLRIEEKYIHSAIEQKVTLTRANPALEEALDAREQGDPERALGLLEEAWRSDREDRDLALALWDTAIACQRPEAGVAAMKILIRLRSTGFDPRALAAGVTDPTDALRAFVGRILEDAAAIALPDPDAARGRPFRVFEDLASYEREVLRVGG
jgi:hypothetical protein